MKRLVTISLAASLLFALAMGCVDGTELGPDKPVSESTADYNDRQDEAVETYCDCYSEDDGYEDKKECEEEEAMPAELNECEERAANCDYRNYALVMECGEEALEDYEECLAECPEDSDAIDECESDLEETNEECDELMSPILSRAFGECRQGAEAPSCNPTREDEESEQEDPCDEGEVYIQLQDGSSECAKVCESNADCPQGDQCINTDQQDTRVCYPADQL